METRKEDYIKFKDGKIEAGLNLFRYDDNGCRVVYSPALEIMGYGRTDEEADADFDFCVREFFHSTTNNGTFEREMSRLGWIRKKTDETLTSPSLLDILPRNEVFRDIFNNFDFRKDNRSLSCSIA